MRKIGILVPSLSDGGAEKVAANLSILFKNLGYDTYLIVYENRVTYQYEGEILDLDIISKEGIFNKIFKDIKIYFKLKKLKKAYNFDMVISHLPKCDLMNTLTKREEKIITTIHNNIEVDYPFYMKLLLKFIVKKSDLVVSVSKVAEDLLKNRFDRYKGKIKTIYNFHEIDKIIEKGRKDLTDSEKVLFREKAIINVGRLDYQKGHWHLIKAFAHLLSKEQEVNLFILGRGKLEEDLKSLTRNLGIEAHVHFLGFKENPYKYLANADLYVSTSLHEGLPMTLIEAMSLGLPIVSTDCVSGPREIIAPEKDIKEVIDYTNGFNYGYLIPDFGNREDLQTVNINKEEEALGELLYNLLENKIKLKTSRKMSVLRSKDFDKESVTQQWVRYLEYIFNDNGETVYEKNSNSGRM
ncbi:glycosyltransferase [Priestia aryabhattai]|uniref:glycosyltransferase n=1 Tax=Priestia aryabhattai TaxID=412384 RepID=UPI002380751B|nr:glycosyltransferase [Priestia aryabhattai]WDW10073.1 glycosyltransferase [Priestia aryabhattai]